MHAWELILQFLQDMRARKLRTALALFGIAWGTISVILLLAVGDTFHRVSSKAMHGMGSGIAIVWPSRTTKAYAGMQPGRRLALKCEDVIRLGQDVPEVGLCSPEVTHWNRTVSFGDHRVKAPVSGVVPEYEVMRNMIAAPGGRFLDPLDVRHRRRVAFIGDEVRRKLFAEEEPVGRTVLVDGRPFAVVGTLCEKVQSSSYNTADADQVFIPYSTFTAMWGDWNVNNFLVTPAVGHDSKPMIRALYEYLGRRYRFDPEDEGALSIWDTLEVDRFLTFFFWGLKALFALSGALTLGAGGIGVANVMFLIVRERTREIGVRMAVGARDGHILAQVLLEALLIVALGGLGGFVASALVIGLCGLLPLPGWLGRPELSPPVALATIGVL
ncbi:MAG: ABC transporter permease, partial [Candidatus Latescibacterota bacterium]